MTNENGDILYVSGRTGKYIEPAAGKANWNIFVMAREGIRYGLSSAFQKAVRTKETAVIKNMEVETAAGKQAVNVTIHPVKGSGSLNGMVMIVFTDIAAKPQISKNGKPRKDTERMAELERDLDRAHQEIQGIREEMQTSQEELKSANEELQSTNEELQSTNEELTTSREEMQSMNEELQTLNIELQAKVDELTQSGNDMKNLLDSTDIATLFLDKDLNVRRFTAQATQIIKLIPGDVGRPITDLVSDLTYPALDEDARKVLRELTSIEKQVGARDGRWFNVRIMPYRTLDDRLDGVVITFTDITAGKRLEAKLSGQHADLKRRFAEQSTELAGPRKRASSAAGTHKRTKVDKKSRRSPKL